MIELKYNEKNGDLWAYNKKMKYKGDWYGPTFDEKAYVGNREKYD